jgi:DNA-binding phage protein
MLQPYNIQDAIKQARRAQKGKKDVQNISRQRLQRIIKGESKATIKELESICAAFGLSIIAVNSAELNKIGQILDILGEFRQKKGK